MIQRLLRPGVRGDRYRLLHDRTPESMVIDTGSHIPGTTEHDLFVLLRTYHVASFLHVKLLT